MNKSTMLASNLRYIAPQLALLVFSAAVAIMAIACTARPLVAAGAKPLVIAHRGASGYAPENTMAAFKLALEMGAAMIELDIYKSADGRLVVMHDDTVDRTTDGKGKIEEMTLEQIEKLDAGVKVNEKFKGERVPTLDDVFG